MRFFWLVRRCFFFSITITSVPAHIGSVQCQCMRKCHPRHTAVVFNRSKKVIRDTEYRVCRRGPEESNLARVQDEQPATM